MLWKILFRIAKRQAWYHLIIPILGGVTFETCTALILRDDRTWNVGQNWQYLKSQEFFAQMVSLEKFSLIGGIVVTYFAMMIFFVKKETSPKVKELDLAVLEKGLENAKSCFATSMIPMESWFDPTAQMYLASIINQRSGSGTFVHERVLLFFNRREVKSLDVPFLDGYYAKCLSHLHHHYGIPLSFLEPDEILKVLRGLTPDDRRNIGCPWYLIQLCERIPSRFLRFGMRRIRGLDFALITKNGGATALTSTIVLRVRRVLTHVGIETITDQRVRSYERLAEAFKQKTHTNGVVNAEHNFISLCRHT